MKEDDGMAALKEVQEFIEGLVDRKKEEKREKAAAKLAAANANKSSNSGTAGSGQMDDKKTNESDESDEEEEEEAEESLVFEDLDPPVLYKALAQGVIRQEASADSPSVGKMMEGQVITATKRTQLDGGVERVFFGDGWVSPVARSGKALLEKLPTRKECEVKLREYIAGKGHGNSADRVIRALAGIVLNPNEWVAELESMEANDELEMFLEACAPEQEQVKESRDECEKRLREFIDEKGHGGFADRVIKALEGIVPDPTQWVSELEGMERNDELDEFLQACAPAPEQPDPEPEEPVSPVKPVQLQGASSVSYDEAHDTDEEESNGTLSPPAMKEDDLDKMQSDLDALNENERSVSPASSDDWLTAHADEPAVAQLGEPPSPKVAAKADTQDFFKQMQAAKAAKAAPAAEPVTEPVDLQTQMPVATYDVMRGDTPAVLHIMPSSILLEVIGSKEQEINYREIRSWQDTGDTISFTDKTGHSEMLTSAEATTIAQEVAAAVVAAAALLSPKSAAMLPYASMSGGSYRVWYSQYGSTIADMDEMTLRVNSEGVVVTMEDGTGRVFKEFPYVTLRSWLADGDSITLSSNDQGSCKFAARDAGDIANAVAEASRRLSQQRKEADESREADEEQLAREADAAKQAAFLASAQEAIHATEQHKAEQQAEAEAAVAKARADAALALAAVKAEAEVAAAKAAAKAEADMAAVKAEAAAKAAAAQAAADVATQAAQYAAMTADQQTQRDAEQREIEMLKAEIAAEQEAAAERSAALEQQREDALEQARQLELIAMAKGRTEEMGRLQDAETARQRAQMEADVEVATLATRQKEQASADAAAASKAVEALPKPSFDPVTAQSPTPVPTRSSTSTLTMNDRAAPLAEADGTPRPMAEVKAGGLSDRQLVLGQAALSTLTERLEEMHRTNPSLLGTARFDALCNTIGDYSQNPTSSALEDLVKTTVRLAGSFKSDAMFAKQLQRKIFPGIGKEDTDDKQGLAPAKQLTGNVAAAEHTSNLVSSLQTEVVTLRQEIMRLGSIVQVASPQLSPGASPEEDRVYSRIAKGDRAAEVTAIAQNLMGSAEELGQPTEESAEASVHSLFEQRPAESKRRSTDRSFAGRLLTLQAQLDEGLITEAQYSDEKRRLSQLAAAPSSPEPELAEATPTPRRHANGAPRIKKDVARSLALACLLRQVSIGELLPIVRSHLGVASISELEELEPADFNAVSLSPLHRRRLLRALDYVKNDIVRDALLEGERMARAGDIQGAIQQCRHALTLGPGGLAPSPTARKPEPADEYDGKDGATSTYPPAKETAERGEGGEMHDHNDPESDFFCDATGQTLRLGAWWHKVGQSYDLCADEFRKLPAGTARAGFILVTKLSDLGSDRHRYGHGTAGAATAEEGVPPQGGHAKPTAPVRPPASRQLRQDIEKMAAYVMRHGGIGGDFDQIARRKQQSNPRFAFMFGGEGSLYYSYVTTELTRRMAVSAAQGLAVAQKT